MRPACGSDSSVTIARKNLWQIPVATYKIPPILNFETLLVGAVRLFVFGCVLAKINDRFSSPLGRVLSKAGSIRCSFALTRL
jgi:hypothetical protein